MADEPCPKCSADAEREIAIAERWERVWSDGRAAGIKTLPYWQAVIAKIREGSPTK